MSDAPSRSIVIITALACEARPLISALGLRPLRENPLGERFQVFHNQGVYVAISGVGKIRAAIATASILSGLFSEAPAPIVANVGIAGTSATDLVFGTPVYIHKVLDVSTTLRFYPDVLVKHGLSELALETHDHPVTALPTERVLVDMEGSGFIQAAATLVPPSNIALIKVISDYCSSEQLTPERAARYIEQNIPEILRILRELRAELPEIPQMNEEEHDLLASVISHANFSLTQRIELQRRLAGLKARKTSFIEELRGILAIPIPSKERRNAVYHELLHKLERSVSL